METLEFDAGQFGLSPQPDVHIELSDAEATRRLGAIFAERLSGGIFVGLVGALGAGKTTFVKGLVETLAAGETARSPTYTLLNEYETTPPVIHVDLYRLDSYDELETTGYWDFVEARGVIACVEWLDRIPAAWPGEGSIVALSHRNDGTRSARIWLADSSPDVLVEHLRDSFAEASDG